MMIFIIFASVGAVLFALLAFLLFFGLRRWYVLGAVFAVLSLFFVLVDIKTLQIHKMTSGGAKGMPPTTVTSAEVKQENWPPLLSAVASISPVQGAVISSELPGTVAQVGFESGAMVKKGDLLVKLDTSAEDAQLRSSEADADWARVSLDRTRELAARTVASKSELDNAEAQFRQKTGAVENMRAMIAKKTMTAPFDGVAGIRGVNVGQMVKAGDEIVPLQSLDSVYADFALPQQNLAELSPGLEVRLTTDAIPGRVFTGKLTAINSMVDMATRNVTLQATLQNPDHALRPGMFAKVDVVLPSKKPVLVI